MNHNVICPYCNEKAELINGEKIYPHRQDLWLKLYYLCAPCKAWVGCHPESSKPLGRLANAELRFAKQQAHSQFDPLWKHGKLTRHQAYAWLAKELEIAIEECHIGEFDVDQCNRVVELCSNRSSNGE